MGSLRINSDASFFHDESKIFFYLISWILFPFFLTSLPIVLAVHTCRQMEFMWIHTYCNRARKNNNIITFESRYKSYRTIIKKKSHLQLSTAFDSILWELTSGFIVPVTFFCEEKLCFVGTHCYVQSDLRSKIEFLVKWKEKKKEKRKRYEMSTIIFFAIPSQDGYIGLGYSCISELP